MDKEAQPSVCKGQPIRTKLGGWVKGRGVRTVDQGAALRLIIKHVRIASSYGLLWD